MIRSCTSFLGDLARKCLCAVFFFGFGDQFTYCCVVTGRTDQHRKIVMLNKERRLQDRVND